MMNHVHRSRFALGASALFLCLGCGNAYANVDREAVRASLVEILDVRGGIRVPIGTGFVVSPNGFVVTVGQQLLRKARRVEVAPVPMEQGARFSVEQRGYHPSLELAVLHAPRLRAPALTLDGVQGPTQPIWVPMVEPKYSMGQGSINSLVNRTVRAYAVAPYDFIYHNTGLLNSHNYGTPVLNQDGYVIGVNHPHPDLAGNILNSRYRYDRLKLRDMTFAVPGPQLEEFLLSQNVPFETAKGLKLESPGSDAPTVPSTSSPIEPDAGELQTGKILAQAMAQLEREREARKEAESAARSARQKATEMERLAKEAELESATSEQEKEAAREAARLADEAAGEAERSATMAQQRAREAEQTTNQLEGELDETDRNIALVASVVALVALAIVALFFFGRRRSGASKVAEAVASAESQVTRRAVQSAPPSPQPAPFACLLEGRAPNGQRFVVKIPAESLGASSGVIVGRNPRYAAFVINHEGISREHVKLSVIDGVLHIEDLGSTNGSFVNNTRLSPKQKMAVHNGFVVKLGPIPFNLTLT